MTEAFVAIIEYVFCSLGIDRIEAAVSTMNLASIKVLMKLNVVSEGVLRQRSFFMG